MISVYRLGKVSNKSRSLQIVLPTPNDEFEILKVKRKLLNDSKFTSVCISADQFIVQRVYYKSVLSELKLRRDSGKDDLMIKYLKNIPTILKNFQSSVQY